MADQEREKHGLFEVRKNSMDVIRAERCHFRGEDLCNIQVWREKAPGEFVRCKGRSVCFKWHLLPDFMEALGRLQAAEDDTQEKRPSAGA